jgi:hypothetical protein
LKHLQLIQSLRINAASPAKSAVAVAKACRINRATPLAKAVKAVSGNADTALRLQEKGKKRGNCRVERFTAR